MARYVRLAERDRPPEDWIVDAACQGQDPRQWDLDVGTAEQLLAGRAVCYGGCPVFEECFRRAKDGGAVGTLSAGLTWGSRRPRPVEGFLGWRAGPGDSHEKDTPLPDVLPKRRVDRRRTAEVDAALVERLVAGDRTAPVRRDPSGSRSAAGRGPAFRREFVAALARLATAGMTDRQIAEHVGGDLTVHAIANLRRLHRIPPGSATGRRKVTGQAHYAGAAEVARRAMVS